MAPELYQNIFGRKNNIHNLDMSKIQIYSLGIIYVKTLFEDEKFIKSNYLAKLNEAKNDVEKYNSLLSEIYKEISDLDIINLSKKIFFRMILICLKFYPEDRLSADELNKLFIASKNDSVTKKDSLYDFTKLYGEIINSRKYTTNNLKSTMDRESGKENQILYHFSGENQNQLKKFQQVNNPASLMYSNNNMNSINIKACTTNIFLQTIKEDELQKYFSEYYDNTKTKKRHNSPSPLRDQDKIVSNSISTCQMDTNFLISRATLNKTLNYFLHHINNLSNNDYPQSIIQIENRNKKSITKLKNDNKKNSNIIKNLEEELVNIKKEMQIAQSKLRENEYLLKNGLNSLSNKKIFLEKNPNSLKEFIDYMIRQLIHNKSELDRITNIAPIYRVL